MKFWEKISRYLLWLTLFILPWQTRYIVAPVYRQGNFIEYASLSIYLTDLLIVILLVSWLPLLIKQRKFKWGPLFLSWPLAVFITLMWLSLLWTGQSGVNIAVSAWAAAHFTLFFLFYLYLINNVKTIRDIILPLGWGIALQGVVALTQYFTNHSLGLKLLGESILDPLQSGIPLVFVEGERQLRAHGSLPHANVLGGYLAVGLVMISSWLYAVRRRLVHYLVWGVFVIGSCGLIVSLSRGAWLAFGLSILLLSVWAAIRRPKKFRAALMPGLIIMMVVAALIISQYQAVASRFDLSQPIEQGSIISRLQQFNEFKDVYLKYPIMGVGLGQYIPYLERLDETTLGWHYREDLGGWVYNPGREGGGYEPVHNMFLLILAELGAIGLFIFMLIVVGAIYLICKLIRDRVALVGVTALLALISILILGMVDHYIWTLQQGRLLFFVVLALISVLYMHSGYNKRYGRRKYRPTT